MTQTGHWRRHRAQRRALARDEWRMLHLSRFGCNSHSSKRCCLQSCDAFLYPDNGRCSESLIPDALDCCGAACKKTACDLMLLQPLHQFHLVDERDRFGRHRMTVQDRPTLLGYAPRAVAIHGFDGSFSIEVISNSPNIAAAEP